MKRHTANTLPPKLRAQLMKTQAKAATRLRPPVQWHFHGLPSYEREYRFHPTRKWRFDYAWPDRKIALEIDGGLYVNGGHSRGRAREGDYEKDAAAMILGWRVLRVSTGQMRSGIALHWLRQILITIK